MTAKDYNMGMICGEKEDDLHRVVKDEDLEKKWNALMEKIPENKMLLLGHLIAVFKKTDADMGRKITKDDAKYYAIFDDSAIATCTMTEFGTYNEDSTFVIMSKAAFVRNVINLDFTALQLLLLSKEMLNRDTVEFDEMRWGYKYGPYESSALKVALLKTLKGHNVDRTNTMYLYKLSSMAMNLLMKMHSMLDRKDRKDKKEWDHMYDKVRFLLVKVVETGYNFLNDKTGGEIESSLHKEITDETPYTLTGDDLEDYVQAFLYDERVESNMQKAEKEKHEWTIDKLEKQQYVYIQSSTMFH